MDQFNVSSTPKCKILSSSKQKKGLSAKVFGFTMAEVLITLAIIGIIAALTLPAFIKSYKQRAYNQHVSVFVQKLAEATRQMNLRSDLTPHSDTMDFVEIFAKYMKIAKICDSNHLENCFIKEINMNGELVEVKDLSSSENFGKKDYKTGNIGLVTMDGLALIISYNPQCPYIDPYDSKDFDTASCLSYILDVNGFNTPNKIGKDIYTTGVEVTLPKKNQFIPIKCNPFGGYGACSSSTLNVDVADAVAGQFLGTSNGGSGQDNYLAASPNGAQMSWGLANKTCKDKGMRLPSAAELHNMYEASQRGEINGFIPANYWASDGAFGESMHNCYMGGGNCGSHGTSDLQYVRCVAP